MRLLPLLSLLLVLPWAAQADWPMHRGGPQLQGRTDMPAPDSPTIAWSVNVGKPVKGGAAIAGGKVFLGDDLGIIHALDLATGKELWTYKTEGSIEATPLVLRDTVYLGSSDSSLYALNSADGKLKWKYETGDKILGGANHVKNPKGEGEWILIGSYDSSLHCVDSVTGKVVWTVQTDNYINGSPALTEDGNVLFGGCDSYIHVISTAEGKETRQIDSDAYIASSVAVMGNLGYVGNYGNVVIAFDATSGDMKWKYRDRNFPYFSSAALTKDKVIIGGRDKRLHCLNRATGEALWHFQTRGQVDSSPVICGESVVFGSQDGRIYSVAVADGQEHWRYEVGAPVTASPAASDGLIVIGAEDGTVLAIGALKGK